MRLLPPTTNDAYSGSRLSADLIRSRLRQPFDPARRYSILYSMRRVIQVVILILLGGVACAVVGFGLPLPNSLRGWLLLVFVIGPALVLLEGICETAAELLVSVLRRTFYPAGLAALLVVSSALSTAGYLLWRSAK